MISDRRWGALVTRMCGNPPPDGVFRRLALAYREPHRHYHNLGHIEHCLQELDGAMDLAEHPDTVEFAIWLHDAVYDPKASDNEEKSARLAIEILAQAGCTEKHVRSQVRDLILATRHGEPPASRDAALVVDIDLSIFGQPREVFDSYEKNIRAEYSWAPEAVYAAVRSRVLNGFLDRPRLYFTERFENIYASAARLNLTRAVSMLRLSVKGE